MNTLRKRFAFSMFLPLILSCAGYLFAQISEPDKNNLQKNIRILEGVLDKLLEDHTSSIHFSHNQTRGIYLEDFGVIFHKNQDAFQKLHSKMTWVYDSHIREFNKKAEEVKESHRKTIEAIDSIRIDLDDVNEVIAHRLPGADFIIPFGIPRESEEAIAEEKKKILNGIKDNIVIFLRDYTTALSRIDDQNHIAVMVNLNEWNWSEGDDSFLSGWVTKGDLDQYRQNQISEEELNNRIHFTRSDSTPAIDRNMAIMSEILNRGLDHESHEKLTNRGIYLDQLGMLFFMHFPLYTFHDEDNFISIISSGNNDKTISYSYGNDGHTSKGTKKSVQPSAKEKLARLKTDFLDIVSSYGHTLQLPPRESIILNINLDQHLALIDTENDIPEKMILQMKKKDINDFTRGIISAGEFEKRLISITY